MKTIVAILNYNGVEHLKTFLPSVTQFSTPPDVEICVIDNASTDNSVDFLRQHYPAIRLILLDKNYGFSEGYNRGLQQLSATYFVLLNNDVEVTENWITPIIDLFDTDEKLVACQPKVLSYRNKSMFEYAGASGGFIDYLGYPFCRGRVMGTVEKDAGQYNSTIDIFWATGACLFVRSESFWRAGALDGSFFAHMEEIDLCWRFKSRGWRVVCCPQSTVYHLGGGTLKKENPQKTYLNFRNNLLMLYKNLPNSELKRVMRKRFWLDQLTMLQFFLIGKIANAKALRKARRDFNLLKSDYTTQRNENLTATLSTSIPEVFSKSLIWNYYLRRKNTFKKLWKK